MGRGFPVLGLLVVMAHVDFDRSQAWMIVFAKETRSEIVIGFFGGCVVSAPWRASSPSAQDYLLCA